MQPQTLQEKQRQIRMLRSYVRGIYDIQKLRVATGNRICINFAAKLGLDLTKKGRPLKGKAAPEAKDEEDDEDLEGADSAAEIEINEQLTELGHETPLEGGIAAVPKLDPAAAESDNGTGKPKPKAALDAKLVDLMMKDLKARYKRITDGIVGVSKSKIYATFKGDEVISDYAELVMIGGYLELIKTEEAGFAALKFKMEEFQIYREWLKHVRGIGPAMGGVIVSGIDIYKAVTPSKIWAFIGADVADDGAGRSRRKEHLVDRSYVTRAGKTETRKSITFNPFLKTKLIGVLGGIFIKLKGRDDCKYGHIYISYKKWLETHPKWGVQNDKKPVNEDKPWLNASKGHRHAMARRYMIKRFLLDLYKAWRTMEGLPLAPDQGGPPQK